MAILDEYSKFSKFEDFKDLYKEFIDTSNKLDKDKTDLNRCIRLQSKVDEAFSKMSKQDKVEAVRYLCDYNLAPKEWLALQMLVDGEFKSITKESDFTIKEAWKA